MLGAGQADFQATLRQGGSQLSDQFRQQGIGAAAMQPRQGFSQCRCHGLEPAGLLQGWGAAHGVPPRA